MSFISPTAVSFKQLIEKREVMIHYCIQIERTLMNECVPNEVKEVLKESLDNVKSKINFIESITLLISSDKISLP
jgi:uncharacterized protein with HEPN domain